MQSYTRCQRRRRSLWLLGKARVILYQVSKKTTKFVVMRESTCNLMPDVKEEEDRDR